MLAWSRQWAGKMMYRLATMEFPIRCIMSEKNWLKSLTNERRSMSLLFASMEYVAHHTPGGTGKSLGDGVGPGLGNGFPLLALRES